jgi:hypothetical protein
MSKRNKLVFLILLSLISVFFAEVISGSSRYPLFGYWGYLVVIPLYGIHTILFLYIIKKFASHKRILFSTLYFAGVLFGLYETYVTKVLWIGLSDDPFILFNVSIIDYIVLVFFWHPIFSFVIPVLVFEKIASKTNYVFQGLPKVIKKFLNSKYGLSIALIIIGLFSAFNGQIESITLSELSILVPITGIILWIYKKELQQKYSLDEMLPSKNEMIIPVIYLIGIYIVLGLSILPEVLTLENQIPIWMSYLVFGYLFYVKLTSNKHIEQTDCLTTKVSLKIISLYAFVILVVSVAFVIVLWLSGIKEVVLIATWVIWNLSGLILLIYAAITPKLSKINSSK